METGKQTREMGELAGGEDERAGEEARGGRVGTRGRGSSFTLWYQRLTTEDTLTRGQIRQLCNAIAPGARGYDIGGHRTNLTHEDCAILRVLFFERVRELGGFKLEPDHTRFGLDWLDKDRKRARGLGITDEMIDGFREFRLVGWEMVAQNHYGRASHVPVYRVISEADEVDYFWPTSSWKEAHGS